MPHKSTTICLIVWVSVWMHGVGARGQERVTDLGQSSGATTKFTATYGPKSQPSLQRVSPTARTVVIRQVSPPSQSELYKQPSRDSLQQTPEALPPGDPAQEILPQATLDEEPLPSLEDELRWHGGSSLYEPEGQRLPGPAAHAPDHSLYLRLPETWQEPRPITAFQEFLGATPASWFPHLHWPGPTEYGWEPRLVIHGSYELFGFALESNRQPQHAIGHHLLADLDLRLTGTERFHLQMRPIGRENTGGSFYQFTQPTGYVDNSTGQPDRYWFEAELHSLLGSCRDPFAVRDFHFVVGRFPLSLHNALLINDDLLGVAVNKNTIYVGPLSNLNIQTFAGINDVDAFIDGDARIYGVHGVADYHHQLIEATYVYVQHEHNADRNAHYAAVSWTKPWGPYTGTARAMAKWGDSAGRGSGQLLTLEGNYVRLLPGCPFGVEKTVLFCNALLATNGWNSIAGGNFNRLRTAFEIDPRTRLAASRRPDDTWSVAVGVQCFCLHDDHSLTVEGSFESPQSRSVWGVGVRYQRKTSARSYFEVLGLYNESSDPRFDRQGVFLSETFLF